MNKNRAPERLFQEIKQVSDSPADIYQSEMVRRMKPEDLSDRNVMYDLWRMHAAQDRYAGIIKQCLNSDGSVDEQSLNKLFLSCIDAATCGCAGMELQGMLEEMIDAALLMLYEKKESLETEEERIQAVEEYLNRQRNVMELAEKSSEELKNILAALIREIAVKAASAEAETQEKSILDREIIEEDMAEEASAKAASVAVSLYMGGDSANPLPYYPDALGFMAASFSDAVATEAPPHETAAGKAGVLGLISVGCAGVMAVGMLSLSAAASVVAGGILHLAGEGSFFRSFSSAFSFLMTRFVSFYRKCGFCAAVGSLTASVGLAVERLVTQQPAQPLTDNEQSEAENTAEQKQDLQLSH